MLTVRKLSKSLGSGQWARTLFADVDLDVAAGEFVALTGESGSGKSTLLNLIAGLDTADSGTIEIAGTRLTALDEGQRSRFRRTHLGFIFQAFHLLPYLSVADNVALPLVITGCAKNDRERRVAQALRDVGLHDMEEAKPYQLSGGEMQRAAIARALIHWPKLILADEPTGNLDADNANQVLDLLRERVSRQDTACLLVTHSAAAARRADRACALENGRLLPSQRP
jgi:putative ABC transport system ATP-binding protein